MKYLSTRGETVAENSYSGIFHSYASDGGMVVPERLPYFDMKHLKSLMLLEPDKRLAEVIHAILPDFSYSEISQSVQSALKENNVGIKVFSMNKYVGRDFLFEMWHNDINCNGEIVLKILKSLWETARSKLNEKYDIRVISATSGGLGCSYVSAFSGTGIKGWVLYPFKSLNSLQCKIISSEAVEINAEMYGIADVSEPGNYHIPMHGSFDQVSGFVEKILKNEAKDHKFLESGVRLTTAGSSCWGRLAIDTALFITAFLDFLKLKEDEEHLDEAVNVVVPAGTLSTFMSVWYARQMGIPVKKIVCASNNNKAMSDFINSGIFDATQESVMTSIPSLDSQKPVNLERLIYELTSHKTERVIKAMKDFESNGVMLTGPDVLRRIKASFAGGFCDHRAGVRTLRDVYDRTDFCLDLNASVCWQVYSRYINKNKDESKVIYISDCCPVYEYEILATAVSSDPIFSAENFANDIGIEVGSLLKAAISEDISDAKLSRKNIFNISELSKVIDEIIKS